MANYNNFQADKIYLGNIEVDKVYLGDILLYEKQVTPTGGGIFVRNNNLIIPQNTIISLRDYASEEGGNINYTLPQDIEVVGNATTSITLDDGTRLTCRPVTGGTNYEYQSGLQYYYSYLNPYKNTITGNIQSKKLSNNLETTTWVRNSNAADIFGFYCTKDADYFSIDIPMFIGGSQGLVYSDLGLSAVYLHDVGTATPSFETHYTGGIVSADDVKLTHYTYSYNNRMVASITQEGLLKAGHNYKVYIVGTKSPWITDANPQRRQIQGTGSSYYPTLTIRKSVPYYNYDMELHVTAGGYKYSEENKQVNITINVPSPYDSGVLGSVKVNSDLHWYDAVPVN